MDMNAVATGTDHQEELSARDLTTIVRKLRTAFAPLVGTIETQQAMIAAQAMQLFHFRYKCGRFDFLWAHRHVYSNTRTPPEHARAHAAHRIRVPPPIDVWSPAAVIP